MVTVKELPELVIMTLATVRPLTNVAYMPLESPSQENEAGMPMASGVPLLEVSVGKAMNGRGAFEAGHDTMKLAARV